MTFLKIFLPMLLFLVVGSFVYLAVLDVPVEQKEIQKVLPNDRFIGNNAP